MTRTPSHTTGPFFPELFIRPGDGDLTVGRGGEPISGAAISIEGIVVDGFGAPVGNAIIELAQTDGSGALAGLGRPFRGWGRTWTDDRGRFRFRTVKPGSYRVAGPDGWTRPPVLRLMVLGSGLMRPLVTELFFPDEPLNAVDRQLAAIADPAARARLILQDGPEPGRFTIAIRLRGDTETPFLAE